MSKELSDKEIINLLVKYGHLKARPEVIKRLKIDDKPVVRAIDSFRGFMGPVSALDTQSLFKVHRCGLPDIVDNATGQGSWRVGCHPNYPNNHSVVYQVNKTRMPGFLKDVFEPAWDLMTQAYAEIGLMIIRDDQTKNYNSLVTFEKGRGWIGLAIVGRNQTCSTKMWAKFDTVYKPSDLLNQWARLLAHELGHNCGLSHTRGGIMNPSITSGVFDKTEWTTDPAYSTLKKWYGGQPVVKTPEWSIPTPQE